MESYRNYKMGQGWKNRVLIIHLVLLVSFQWMTFGYAAGEPVGSSPTTGTGTQVGTSLGTGLGTQTVVATSVGTGTSTGTSTTIGFLAGDDPLSAATTETGSGVSTSSSIITQTSSTSSGMATSVNTGNATSVASGTSSSVSTGTQTAITQTTVTSSGTATSVNTTSATSVASGTNSSVATSSVTSVSTGTVTAQSTGTASSTATATGIVIAQTPIYYPTPISSSYYTNTYSSTSTATTPRASTPTHSPNTGSSSASKGESPVSKVAQPASDPLRPSEVNGGRANIEISPKTNAPSITFEPFQSVEVDLTSGNHMKVYFQDAQTLVIEEFFKGGTGGAETGSKYVMNVNDAMLNYFPTLEEGSKKVLAPNQNPEEFQKRMSEMIYKADGTLREAFKNQIPGVLMKNMERLIGMYNNLDQSISQSTGGALHPYSRTVSAQGMFLNLDEGPSNKKEKTDESSNVFGEGPLSKATP